MRTGETEKFSSDTCSLRYCAIIAGPDIGALKRPINRTLDFVISQERLGQRGGPLRKAPQGPLALDEKAPVKASTFSKGLLCLCRCPFCDCSKNLKKSKGVGCSKHCCFFRYLALSFVCATSLLQKSLFFCFLSGRLSLPRDHIFCEKAPKI